MSEIIGWFMGKPVTTNTPNIQEILGDFRFLRNDHYEPHIEDWKCGYCGSWHPHTIYKCDTCGAPKKDR